MPETDVPQMDDAETVTPRLMAERDVSRQMGSIGECLSDVKLRQSRMMPRRMPLRRMFPRRMEPIRMPPETDAPETDRTETDPPSDGCP